MTVFRLPDLGEGLSEAEILHWHVTIGDRIEADAPMLSVETAKAVVEVPSPVSGRVTMLHAQPGDRLATGAPLVEFETDAPAHPDPGTLVGQMPTASTDPTPAAARVANMQTRVRALPAARALARGLGLDLVQLSGTGRDGLITLEDVMAAGGPARLMGKTENSASARSAVAASGAAQELRSLRRAMSESMSLARNQVMECSVFDDADLHAWRAGEDYTPRVLRAIVAGARAEPALNAWFDAASQTRILFPHLDIGVAVDTGDGLLVPVIRQVHSHSAEQLRAELDRLKRAAQARTVTREELRGFTFILSNFGTLAGRYATPVVLPPAVAVLGTGRARSDVVAVNERIEVHRRLPLSLTFDHRVVTGGEAVRFMAAVLADLELPE